MLIALTHNALTRSHAVAMAAYAHQEPLHAHCVECAPFMSADDSHNKQVRNTIEAYNK